MKCVLNKIKLLPFVLGFFMAGCEGTACPTIDIPILRVAVVDAVDGTVLCNYVLSNYHLFQESTEVNMCTLSFSLSDTVPNTAEITVSQEGYETQTLSNVAHNHYRYRCFDSPSYTEYATVYLESSS